MGGEVLMIECKNGLEKGLANLWRGKNIKNSNLVASKKPNGKCRMNINGIGRAIQFLFFVVSMQSAWATAYKSASSGNWINSTTWTPSGLPTNTDTVEIQNGNSVTNANTTSVGSLTINSGGTLQVGGPASENRCVLTIGGSLTNNGTIHVYSPTVANQFTFSGNGFWSGSGDISSGKLRLTIQAGASLDISRLTTALKFLNNSTEANTNNGTLVAGPQVVNGNGNTLCTFTFNPGSTLNTANPNGIINGTSGTFNFAGTVSLSPGVNCIFSGTSAQVTAGLPSTVNSLSISNNTGVTLSAAVTATNLTLQAGLLSTTSGNLLTIASGGTIVGGSSNAFVNGPLAMTYSTAGSQTFPTGAGGNYRPVTLNYTALTGASTVTVQQVESSMGGTTPANTIQFTNRYWVISQIGGGAFTCSLTLNTNGFLPLGTGVIIQQGTPNTAYPVTISPPNYTAAGITALGNFTFGSASTLTVQANILGSTPQITGYNSGHFYPGSNTRDWWRYSGVTGARVFWLSSAIEPVNIITNAAKLVGVSNQASFLICRAAMHTNQFNPNYINWSVITNNFNTNNGNPLVHLFVAPALAYLQGLGVQVCAQFSASPNWMPIADTNDWAGMWGLWHHYYAEAFYLGRYFDVQSYQMYNEPNLATNLTLTNYLLRLQLATDAISNALSDVDLLYGKSLMPILHAPVVSSGVDTFSSWGELVVTNLTNNFFAPADTNYWLFKKYDYHEYGDGRTAEQFGTDLATLNANLQTAMTPETPLPVAISEFNNYTEGNFDLITNTLDMPNEYTYLGATAANLMANNINELYCFMFSQVANISGNYPVLKNALHYVDNTNEPYNIGGITKAGEVYRLFNKAFATGRTRLEVTPSGAATNLVAQASYNPVTQHYYLYSVNNSASAVSMNLDLSALNIPTGNHVLLEEVSETNYGTGSLWTNLPANVFIPTMQNSNTVWLLTASGCPEQAEQVITALDNAEVCDGTNSAVNYGFATTMTVRNNPANTAKRSAALMKFHLPVTNLNNLDFALLSINAACATSNYLAQAHVYFLNSTNWSQSTVTWSSAPNLKQNTPAGSNIINSVIQGVGTNASIVGQIVVTTTNVSEKLIDLTGFLRSQTNLDFSILVVQDPRWDVALPAMTMGDIQPDGVNITTTEGGAGPSLRLVLSNSGITTVSNILVSINYGTITTGATPAECFVLNISGAANNEFRLQATTNLLGGNWTSIRTNTFDANGVWSNTNFDLTNYPCRFYRVVSP